MRLFFLSYILIHFRLFKKMLSDLVDDDLLTGSVTVPTSTKTMVNMTNTGKFKDFSRLTGYIDLVMTITYGI
jgi:hypothetical protein